MKETNISNCCARERDVKCCDNREIQGVAVGKLYRVYINIYYIIEFFDMV